MSNEFKSTVNLLHTILNFNNTVILVTSPYLNVVFVHQLLLHTAWRVERFYLWKTQEGTSNYYVSSNWEHSLKIKTRPATWKGLEHRWLSRVKVTQKNRRNRKNQTLEILFVCLFLIWPDNSWRRDCKNINPKLIYKPLKSWNANECIRGKNAN